MAGRVLDPWNGGGTTTAAAAQAGIRSTGCDINPVSIVLSKARLIFRGDLLSLEPLSTAIANNSVGFALNVSEPLTTWFSQETALVIRSLELSVRQFLVPARELVNQVIDVSDLSNLAAFFYLALFRTVRHLLAPMRVSNPTWIKRGSAVSTKLEVSRSIIVDSFLATVIQLCSGIAVEGDERAPAPADCELLLASSEHLPLPSASFDLAISSPPYCTRIDYGVATLPELAILNFDFKQGLRQLRDSLIGTPTICRGAPPVQQLALGPTCVAFLDVVSKHNSRASKSYYLKTHLQYFGSIARSLREVSRCLKTGGKAYLVVQDSYYKEVYNDLPKIFVEIAEMNSLNLFRRENFQVSRSMAGINSGVKRYRSNSKATETVLCFVRGRNAI